MNIHDIKAYMYHIFIYTYLYAYILYMCIINLHTYINEPIYVMGEVHLYFSCEFSPKKKKCEIHSRVE